jgi:hypothetical protein
MSKIGKMMGTYFSNDSDSLFVISCQRTVGAATTTGGALAGTATFLLPPTEGELERWGGPKILLLVAVGPIGGWMGA